MQVVEVLKTDAAFEAFCNFLGIVLESLQARNLDHLAVDLDGVTDDPDQTIALDLTLGDHTTGNGADPGYLEGVTDLDGTDLKPHELQD